MARVLATGGRGFLGCAIIEALAARGDHVIAFVRAIGPALERLAAGHDNVRPAVGEVTEWPHVADVIARLRIATERRIVPRKGKKGRSRLRERHHDKK